MGPMITLQRMSAIYTRGMILIGASLVLITIVLTYVTVHEQQNILTQDLKLRVIQSDRQLAVSVASGLWTLNRATTEIVLQGVARDPDFLAATVLDDKGRVFARVGADDVRDRPIEESKAPIVWEEDGNHQLMGSLILAFSRERLDRDLRASLWSAIVRGLLQLAAVLVATAIALRAVTRPLETISHRMIEIARGEKLDGIVPHMDRRDQIGNIARAVGIFRSETLKRMQAEEALRQAHDDLESRVQERTEELRRTTDQLEAIISSSPLAIGCLDPQQRVIIWNRTAERMFGYSQDEVIGHPYPLIPPGAREEFQSHFEQVVKGEVVRGLVSHRRRRDGNIIATRSSAAGIFDSTGTLQGVIFAIEDITEHNANEKRRSELEALLHHSQKLEALGTLAGGIAHDLNNALVPTIMITDMVMKKHAEDSPERTHLALALAGARRARDLVKRILTFARKETTEKHELDLADLVTEAMTMLRATLPATIELIALVESIPTVFGDSGQLYQAIVNLVTNAAQAIGDEPGKITVTLRSALGGSQIELTVADTGSGMDEATKQRIFDPFFTTKAVNEGTGLGLSIVHGVVVAHGGTIAVTSQLARGSTFSITLPVAGQCQEDDAETVPAAA
jgi:PAS domain S-box-containing protein